MCDGRALSNQSMYSLLLCVLYGHAALSTTQHSTKWIPEIKELRWNHRVHYATAEHTLSCNFAQVISPCGGRDSSVGIATRYGLDGPEIECRWWRDFPHPSRPALGPTQPPVQWVPGLSRRYSGRGVVLSPTPIFSAEVLNRVELYLYPP